METHETYRNRLFWFVLFSAREQPAFPSPPTPRGLFPAQEQSPGLGRPSIPAWHPRAVPAQPWQPGQCGHPAARLAGGRCLQEPGALCQPQLVPPSLPGALQGTGAGRGRGSCSARPVPEQLLHHLLGLVTGGCSRATTRGRQRGLFTRKLRLPFHPRGREKERLWEWD